MTFLDNHVADGGTVHISILPGVSVRGRVVWSTGYSVGIQFERAIDKALAVQLELEAASAEMTVVEQPAEIPSAVKLPHRLRQLIASKFTPLS